MPDCAYFKWATECKCNPCGCRPLPICPPGWFTDIYGKHPDRRPVEIGIRRPIGYGCTSYIHWCHPGGPGVEWPGGTAPTPRDPTDCGKDEPSQVYEIKIPGLWNIIRTPGKEIPEEKKAAIKRALAAKSPLPQQLQWIPSLINMLDDAQDLMYTALTIGKWLAPRVFLRLLPGLGWILLANDAINVTTGLLSTALAGRSFKRGLMETAELLGTRRVRRLRKAVRFLQRTNITSFVLQGLQASHTVSGYGLALGGVMGYMTDTLWGAVRSAQGEKVVLRYPPPDDMLGKAARFLNQSPQQFLFSDALSPEHHQLLLTAHAVATKIVMEQTTPDRVESRIDEAMNLRVPTQELWNESSKCACQEFDIEWRVDRNDALGPAIPTAQKNPTYREWYELHAQNVQPFEDSMRRVMGDTSMGTSMCAIYNEAGIDAWKWASQDKQIIMPEYTELEQDAASAVEFSVFPHDDASPESVAEWLAYARELSLGEGYTRASFKALQHAANAILGGFQRKEYRTLHLPPSEYTPNTGVTAYYEILDCDSRIVVAHAPTRAFAAAEARRYYAIYPDATFCIRNMESGAENVVAKPDDLEPEE